MCTGAEGAILASVVGAGATLSAADKASSATSSASKTQKAALDKKNAYQDMVQGIVDKYKASGGFDADKQIQTMQSDLSNWEKKDLQNAAGAASSLGYRKGETPAEDALAGVRAKYASRVAELSNNIRQNVFNQELSAYRSASPDYTADINAASNNLSYARSQEAGTGNLTPVVSSFTQWMASLNKNVPKSTGPIVETGTQWNPQSYADRITSGTTYPGFGLFND
jgi:hypothetical protein